MGRRFGHEPRDDRNPSRLTRLMPRFTANPIHLALYTDQAMLQVIHVVLELPDLA